VVQRHAAPRLQQSRTQLAIAEDCAGIPTRLQGSAIDTPSRLSCHLTCDKGRRAPAGARTNCRQVQHSARDEKRLPERLTDHALGRGARLTQVQVERGGSWVLAQTEPGGTSRERQLKQHGAARRCEVCKAIKGYQAGELSRELALARAGWDRASQHERRLLLDMFGLSQAPHPGASGDGPRPGMPAPQPGPASGEVRDIPAPRPAPAERYITPEVVALVGQLETAWAAGHEAAPRAAAGFPETEAWS